MCVALQNTLDRSSLKTCSTTLKKPLYERIQKSSLAGVPRERLVVQIGRALEALRVGLFGCRRTLHGQGQRPTDPFAILRSKFERGRETGVCAL